jgi:hypothetical protein
MLDAGRVGRVTDVSKVAALLMERAEVYRSYDALRREAVSWRGAMS